MAWPLHVQSATPAFAAFRSQAKRSPEGSSREIPEDSKHASKRNKCTESAQETGSAADGSEVTLAHGIADAAVTSSEVEAHLIRHDMRWCGSQVTLESASAEASASDSELRSNASLQGPKYACSSLHCFRQ